LAEIESRMLPVLVQEGAPGFFPFMRLHE
jgi:hypothetical protein